MNSGIPVLSLQKVVKRYHNHVAVDNISFDVNQGTIFGLLGPNGAGKTSLIRIITRITAADEGEILINGEKLHALHPHKIGYMPEERGLYKKMKVGEQLIYLAQLKGLSYSESKQKLGVWMKKFDITSWWDKKIGDLSKGMQQKVQFIATVIHDPSLIILDEPFSGLDPINSNLIKDEIFALKEKGVSILFSTHRMEQVEEICEKIVLVNKGKKILDGVVSDIKQSFKENKFCVKYNGNLNLSLLENSDFNIIEQNHQELIIKLSPEKSPNFLLTSLLKEGIEIHYFNEVLPSLNEIFIKKVEQNNE
ncbi:MAG: ATP-binding cassette domain-containing protein [Saprospiraceae bacterium]|nr:ATP-binding cassette domain-containing protein [Saprospiraceae bacterium]MBK6564576.1 ATP-binding cassette domain-containing protein [Saprospiraceae bacterium]MBK7523218.1 ATP-binding cassette domain-containing protein [Saprospiraceae bacterium]MBK8547057.1 ATP-binding cassette domain-containing protein [Saprospiraceae bacterium]MBK9042065.1 ATP-binding cassette domain-containing protein [Saprospiraceae bacterium]